MSDSPSENPTIDQETTNHLEYLGSILAAIVILATVSLAILTATGYADLALIPQPWFVAVIVPIVTMSAIEAFGAEVYDVFTKNK